MKKKFEKNVNFQQEISNIKNFCLTDWLSEIFIVIFAWPQGNPYQTLAACDMWLLTQFLIPCVTSGQGPVKRSRSGQVIKIYFLLIFIYNFAPILYPTGWNFCVVGAPTGQAIARPVCKYFLILKFFGENFFFKF